jgi:adenylate cyclase
VVSELSASFGDAATVAFVDLAGFSAVADVFGDLAAVRMVELFEVLVCEALGGTRRPVKWLGDAAMLGFPDPAVALGTLGRLIGACRAEPRLPLTRTGLSHGPVIRRGGDLFGRTVNLAARVAELAGPGNLVATAAVAEEAARLGIAVRSLGPVAIRSLATPVPLFEIDFAPQPDPNWIDPVCKMLAPLAAYRRAAEGHWFCSPRCEAAYEASPETYRRPGQAATAW